MAKEYGFQVFSITNDMQNVLVAGAARFAGPEYVSMLNQSIASEELRQVAVEGKISTPPSTTTTTNQRLVPHCVKSEVPKKLHFVWVGSSLPQKHAETITFHAKMNPGWDIYLWTDHPAEHLEQLLQPYHASNTFHIRNTNDYMNNGKFYNTDLIRRQPNLGGKSDYIRLEAVYLEGGIYQDTDAHPLRPWDSAGDLFHWPFVAMGYNLCNCVFGFEQYSPFLKFARELASETCEVFSRCKVGESAGPTFFTASVAIYNHPDIVIVMYNYLTHGSGETSAMTTHDFEGSWTKKA